MEFGSIRRAMRTLLHTEFAALLARAGVPRWTTLLARALQELRPETLADHGRRNRIRLA